MEDKETSSKPNTANVSEADANIRTYLRIRPSKSNSGYFKVDDLNEQALHFYLPENYKPASDYVNNTKTHYSYQFHGIIPMKATQEEVFQRVGVEAVRNALDGYNSTIFAYGQVTFIHVHRSGKTFTLTGGQERYSDRGLIPRTLSMIFQERKSGGDIQYKYFISYMEIYNEEGYDLLGSKGKSANSDGRDGLETLPKISMLEDDKGNFHIKNLSMHVAETEEEALDLLFIGDTNRAVAETPMNLASSRSHCIFTISIEGRVLSSDRVRRSKLHLVDLAGSERVGKTNSSGVVLQQAKYINSSLFYLEMVIVALYERATKGRSHIPYRNSMMTSALRDSLGGNCKTIMVATINPESAQTEESLSTCRFAQRVSMIKNKATINEDVDPSILIQKLKTEMLNMREEIVYLKGEAGEGQPLSAEEIEDLKLKCRTYCDSSDPHSTLDIGKLTLTKIKDAFAVMKNLVLEARSQSTTANSNNGIILNPASIRSHQPSDENTVRELQLELDQLKSSLLQREHEIKILVNMVKKGVRPDDINSSKVGSKGYHQDYVTSNQENATSSNNPSSSDRNSDKTRNEKASGLKSLQEQQREREAAREELIVKRHLFGVPPPNDKVVFDDAAASYQWFRERCSLNASMEENMDLLKQRIKEAKEVGERANQSRNSITYLKNSIEAIRKERAMAGIMRSDAKIESKDDDLESPEELTHRKAIEHEKTIYKESSERLRILKPEIEQIKKLLETSRMKLQSQFDEWYDNLHSRKLYDTDNQSAIATSAYRSPRPSNAVSNTSILSNQSFSQSDTLTSESDRTSVESGSMYSMNQSSQRRNSLSTTQRRSEPHQAKVDGLAPSKDETVNDDILAFYQAKEEMLKRKTKR